MFIRSSRFMNHRSEIRLDNRICLSFLVYFLILWSLIGLLCRLIGLYNNL